ncbi:Hypothetical protein PHPALM_214 [Phytophthora palmivora]|uniref:BED-type domain-containing protein n=1 Tax=Phytophthora palmivora TaxID=4796 RepID=A0A2P4YVD3_9STRA|nr:Hypothetical protein PHPALM_214 [Phytophthora palmivora]
MTRHVAVLSKRIVVSLQALLSDGALINPQVLLSEDVAVSLRALFSEDAVVNLRAVLKEVALVSRHLLLIEGVLGRHQEINVIKPQEVFVVGEENHHRNNMLRLVLFDILKKRKPQHWHFIQLVCKDEFIGMDVKPLRSQRARCAYCNKCKIENLFEKSSTAHVTRHMQKRHPKELKKPRKMKMLTSIAKPRH